MMAEVGESKSLTFDGEGSEDGEVPLCWDVRPGYSDYIARGSALVHENTFYCTNRYEANIIFNYTECEPPKRHSVCPHAHAALAVINGLLSVTGGLARDWRGKSKKTGKILSWNENKWQELVAPMKTARYNHTSATISNTVIVAGGDDTETSVEIWDGRKWSNLPSLPHPLSNITSTICGDSIYVMGDDGLIFSASLQSLQTSHSSWQPLPSPPVTHTTLSSLSGCVLTFGGYRNKTVTAEVHTLTHSGVWVRNSSKLNAKCISPLVGVLSPASILVMGSCSPEKSKCNLGDYLRRNYTRLPVNIGLLMVNK